jgi:DNA-binding transcriptional regulator YdaS (Cro superfamily)
MNLSSYLSGQGVTQRDMASRLGVTPSLIWQWISGHRPVSAEQAIAIERETAGAVTCEELRPDVDWAYLRGRRKPRKTA